MKKCIDCPYITYSGKGITAGWRCSHPNIEESAKKYENLKRKRIVKSIDYISNEIPKTSLRWCPEKMKKKVKE